MKMYVVIYDVLMNAVQALRMITVAIDFYLSCAHEAAQRIDHQFLGGTL